MKRKFFSLILIIFFYSFTENSRAQGEGDALRLSDIGLGSGARALGMGNAYQSLSDDYSAASFNPAGFGLLKRMEFAGGINYSKFNNTTTYWSNTTDYSNSETNLNQFSFAFPFPTIRGSLVFAVGYNRDKEFNKAVNFNGFNNDSTTLVQDPSYSDLFDPDNLALTDKDGNTPIKGFLNQEGTILNNGGIGRWSFSGAVEILKNVFAGATFNIISGSYKSTFDYYETDTENRYKGGLLTNPADSNTANFQEFYLNEILNWDISGWDAKIGFLYQINPMIRLGASIKFPTSYTIKETSTLDGQSTFAKVIYYPTSSLEYKQEYEISTPYQISGGASMNYKGFILSGDFTFIDFTQMEYKSGLNALNISRNNRYIKEDFSEVINYNLGAEYTIPDINLRLRGGFIMNPSPYKNDPSERNRKYLTGGIGFLADEAFAIDLAFAHGWWKNIGQNYFTALENTNQDIRINNLILSVSYRF